MLFTLAKWGVKLGFKSVKYSYKGVKYGTKVYKARKRKQTASKSANEELSSSNSSFDSGTSGGEWQPQGQPPSTFSSGSEKLQTNKSRNAAQPSNELQELQMNKHRKWITNVIKNAIGFGSAQPRTSGAVAIALVEQAAQGCSLGVMWGDLCRISVKFFGWHSITINLRHADTPLGIMEDLLNTMLYLFRQGLYALVFGWMFASWFMINDSLNPKLKERMHGRLSCGVMLFIYTPMFLLNMFMNGIVAYLVVWSRMMGDNLRFPAGWDEENQQFIMESAGDVTGLRTKVQPLIGANLGATAFGLQLVVIFMRRFCTTRRPTYG